MTELDVEHRPVRVWDLPTRCFHWTLVAAVVGLFATGYAGNMTWHPRLGLLVAALLVFRLVWGVVGGHWSRFATFVPTPGRLLRYLRGQARADEHAEVGHNPLGSLSVLAMLAILLVQVGTGLVADDESFTTGPLNRFVASATGLAATAWHKGWGQRLIMVLVLLHVAAIVFYTLRGHRLVRAMWGGDKALPAATAAPAAADGARPRLLALVIALLCGAAAVGVWRLGS